LGAHLRPIATIRFVVPPRTTVAGLKIDPDVKLAFASHGLNFDSNQTRRAVRFLFAERYRSEYCI
jgi:hypothetical protein